MVRRLLPDQRRADEKDERQRHLAATSMFGQAGPPAAGRAPRLVGEQALEVWREAAKPGTTPTMTPMTRPRPSAKASAAASTPRPFSHGIIDS